MTYTEFVSTLMLVGVPIGLLATHLLSVRRQRRDEFFKLMVEARQLIHQVSETAVQCWALPGSAKECAPKIVQLKSSLGRLGRLLTSLDRRGDGYSTTVQLVQFRRACTLDIEDEARAASMDRVQEIVDKAGDLDARVEFVFSKLHA